MSGPVVVNVIWFGMCGMLPEPLTARAMRTRDIPEALCP
jgi:hypothetical protein